MINLDTESLEGQKQSRMNRELAVVINYNYVLQKFITIS